MKKYEMIEGKCMKRISTHALKIACGLLFVALAAGVFAQDKPSLGIVEAATLAQKEFDRHEEFKGRFIVSIIYIDDKVRAHYEAYIGPKHYGDNATGEAGERIKVITYLRIDLDRTVTIREGKVAAPESSTRKMVIPKREQE
jgi:hypothetical protein